MTREQHEPEGVRDIAIRSNPQAACTLNDPLPVQIDQDAAATRFVTRIVCCGCNCRFRWRHAAGGEGKRVSTLLWQRRVGLSLPLQVVPASARVIIQRRPTSTLARGFGGRNNKRTNGV